MHPPNFFDSLFDVAGDVVAIATPVAALFNGGDDHAQAPVVQQVAQPAHVAAGPSNDTVLILAAVALLVLFK